MDHKPYFRWGKIETEKLPGDFDLNQVKRARPLVVDEPVFSSSGSVVNVNDYHYDTSLKTNDKILASSRNLKQRETQVKKIETKSFENKNVQANLQPTIDSYIINTIKLNRILKNNLTFEQIECFNNKSAKKSVTPTKSIIINTDEEARYALKQFIVIMSLHSGFTEASSLSLDILVEVLDDYIGVIFKLLKNFQNIHQADLNKNDPKSSLVQYNFYSNKLFMKQAFEELGIGTVENLKNFYQNEIINYHHETFKKVSKLYKDYRARKLAEKLTIKANNVNHKIKTEGEIKVEEFIRENDFLNDESNMILGELLTDLNVTHFDEDMTTRLLQMIGSDPFSLIPEDNL